LLTNAADTGRTFYTPYSTMTTTSVIPALQQVVPPHEEAQHRDGNAGQRDGYYKIENMLRAVVRRGEIGVCGTCMDAPGISDSELIESTKRSTLEELTDWTRWADKTLVF
jgi:sulfur relay (sulfurtransferase) complex TusBCD TusD component (DsrE family)